MAHHGKEGAIKSGSTLMGAVTGFTIDTTADVVEETLDSDITRNGNAIDTLLVEADTDEGIIFPYGGVRIVVRVIYEFTRGTA